MNTLLQRIDASVLSLILLIGMVVMIILGKRAGSIWNKEPRELKGGVSSLFGALFALSGLILAFTFGMSHNRLDKVRTVVELEATDIGTAILRSDLYDDTVREGFRGDFKKYLESVIAYYDHAVYREQRHQAQLDASAVAEKLWTRAVRQSKQPNMLTPSLQMIPALNDMFDIAERRDLVLKSKIPDLIVYMLFVCVLVGCFIGGFTSTQFRSGDRIIIGGFVIVTAMVVYTTLDLSRPLRGIITDVPGTEAIVELREMFK
jgi:hypothetical protein